MPQRTDIEGEKSVKINVGALQVTDNARISVSSQGVGDAGNLSVKANQLRLDQQGSLQAESIAGKQGNIGLTLSEALLPW
jgi:large exoprotein involved in heme utilization and adhesion